MDGYYGSFLVTHLINFLLSIRLLLRITIRSVLLYIPLLAAAAGAFGIWAASHVSGAMERSISYLLILGSLLFLFRVLDRSDIQWAKNLIYKK